MYLIIMSALIPIAARVDNVLWMNYRGPLLRLKLNTNLKFLVSRRNMNQKSVNTRSKSRLCQGPTASWRRTTAPWQTN